MMFIQHSLYLAAIAPLVCSLQEHNSTFQNPPFYDEMVYDEDMRCAVVRRRLACTDVCCNSQRVTHEEIRRKVRRRMTKCRDCGYSWDGEFDRFHHKCTPKVTANTTVKPQNKTAPTSAEAVGAKSSASTSAAGTASSEVTINTRRRMIDSNSVTLTLSHEPLSMNDWRKNGFRFIGNFEVYASCFSWTGMWGGANFKRSLFFHKDGTLLFCTKTEECSNYTPAKINDLLPKTCCLDLKKNKPTETFDRARSGNWWYVLTDEIWLRGDDYNRFGEPIGHEWWQLMHKSHWKNSSTPAPARVTASQSLFTAFFWNLYCLATGDAATRKWLEDRGYTHTKFGKKDGCTWQNLVSSVSGTNKLPWENQVDMAD